LYVPTAYRVGCRSKKKIKVASVITHKDFSRAANRYAVDQKIMMTRSLF
jgi:hypothetical protein